MADQPDPPLNRAQRRRQRFRRASDAPQDNLRRQSENNPAFGNSTGAGRQAEAEEGPSGAVTQEATEGETRQTGPGTGGATESGERAPAYEGVHRGRGRSAKG